MKTKKNTQQINKPIRRLLTIKEAAEYLGRSVDSMRELLYSREMKCIQKGKGKIWVDIRDLDAWIDSNKSYMRGVNEPLSNENWKRRHDER